MVKPKKSLGQHFLIDKDIAKRIVSSLAEVHGTVMEIGSGTGSLTRFLLEQKNIELYAVEIDQESCLFLKKKYPQLQNRLIEKDVLQLNWHILGNGINIIGNLPYFIASQIFFKILDHYKQVDTVVCMLQKEVAVRLASTKGNKKYGLLSVLLQAYYNIEFLFEVFPTAFSPPPKVNSAVIKLTRNMRKQLECNEKYFRQVVKQGFQMRRKTLRNALKKLNLSTIPSTKKLLDKRAEQLSVEDFILLTREFEKQK